MTKRTLSDQYLLEKLNSHPTLRERVGYLLLAVEDETGDLKEADAAEMCLIEEMRQMGRESLTAWAERQVVKTAEEARQADSAWREGKKTLLAHDLRRRKRGRTPTNCAREPSASAPLSEARTFTIAAARQLAPLATGGHGFCGGCVFCPGNG